MSDRLRVLYLCGWPVGPNGEGAVSFVHEQIVELSGHVDALFVEHGFASLKDLVSHPVRSLKPQTAKGAWPESVRALRARTIRLPTRLTRRTLLDDIRKAGVAVARRLRIANERVDLVHAHVVLPAGLLGAHLARELGVPMILQEHSGPFDMHLDTDEKTAAVRETLSGAAVVLAVSQSLARSIRNVSPDLEQLAVLPNLVKTDVFHAAARLSEGEPLRLISVGGLVPVKDHALLLECVSDILTRGHSVMLALVGDGPLRPVLERRARKLGVEGRVTFTGHLSRSATARALAASHIYVCCSRIETFGLAVAEALATGRPVVTTACGGPEEIVGPGLGQVVRSNDPSAIADAILDVQDRLNMFDPESLHADMERRFGSAAFQTRLLAAYDRAMSSRS